MKIEVANIRLFTRKLCATFVNINLMENNRYVFALQKPYFYTAKTILLDDENMAFVSLKHRDSYAVAIFLNANNIFIVKWYCFF